MFVYVEYAVLDNLIIDYFLIKTSLRFGGVKIKKLKVLFASVIATIFAIVMPMFNVNNILAFFLKILLAICIILLSGEYTSIKSYIFTLNIFILLTFVTGGGVIAILYLLNMQYVLVGGEIVNQGFPISVIIASALIITSVIVRISKTIYRKKQLIPFMQKCQIVINGKGFSLNGFIDTGNRLYDDKMGCPIIVISKKMAEKHNVIPYLTEQIAVLKFSTISGQSAMPVYKLSGIILYVNNRVLYKSASLAITSSDYDSDYDIILHPALI